MVISKGYPVFIKDLVEGIINGEITAAEAKENTYTIFVLEVFQQNDPFLSLAALMMYASGEVQPKIRSDLYKLKNIHWVKEGIVERFGYLDRSMTIDEMLEICFKKEVLERVEEVKRSSSSQEGKPEEHIKKESGN